MQGLYADLLRPHTDLFSCFLQKCLLSIGGGVLKNKQKKGPGAQPKKYIDGIEDVEARISLL